ncbi:MAG: tetratricopeptide repeat protein [Pyrinomonadaceae bacterium]|nr:tetratricopeptide repeat protein [Pyrinomonadaceae bacterium]
MTKRFTVILAIFLYSLAALPASHPAYAKDTWVSVRSNNFFLVGNASEKEVRQVATRLEQFREVFSRLFPRTTFTSPVPTTVVVFKSDSSYKPFKPVVDGKTVAVAGYFQPGREVNYITLTTEKREENPYAVIFHEYVHLLVNNNLGRGSIPTWFNEGLAEYYSTFDIEDDQQIQLGKLISSHIHLLRTSQLIPLDRLFTIDYYSLDRNKHDARGLFYAESWALIHYLIRGNEGKRARQLGIFLDQLRQNIPAEKAFREAFQTDYAGMQKELRDYIQRHSFQSQILTFKQKLELSAEMKTAIITDAEAQTFLGDLLFHIQRPADAKTKLEEALSLDPKLAMAHASLGMVLMQEKKFSEAREHLQQAIAENSTSYLAHYYYAYALSREFMTEGQMVHDFPTEAAVRMRAELVRAIELKPDFPESYHLLAFVNLVTGEQLDESIVMIKRAVALSPGSEEFLFALAQLYLRTQDIEGARKVIEPLAANSGDPQIRAKAVSLLASISSRQEAMARFRTEGAGKVVVDTKTDEDRNTDPNSHLRDALRKPESGEKQVQAILVRIECDGKGIVFTLKSGADLLKLRTASFDEIDITTYASDVAGEITCGVRKPESAVVVCYLPGSDVRARTGGTIRSLEFVPRDFKLTP